MTHIDAFMAALRAKAGADFRYRREVKPWRSGSLVGELHALTLLFAHAADGARLLDGLGAYEFTLPAHFVADIAAEARTGARVELEALILTSD